MSIIEKTLDKLYGENQGQKTKSNTIGSLVKEAEVTQDIDSVQPVIESQPITEAKKTSPDIKKTSKIINIDIERLGNLGFLTPDTQNRRLFEELRRIKMRILAKTVQDETNQNKYKNLIMVTSSIAGEGKSFTSLNLAMSIAYEYNYTVLLVDADVIKRTTSARMDVTNHPGLMDYLIRDDQELPDLLLKTNIEKLNILPCGQSSERITEHFSSHKMANLMTELSERYSDRIIIFDVPPLLQESSSAALTKYVSQLILVIEAEKTPIHLVKDALRSIKDPVNISLVLNKSNQKSEQYYYYNSYNQSD